MRCSECEWSNRRKQPSLIAVLFYSLPQPISTTITLWDRYLLVYARPIPSPNWRLIVNWSARAAPIALKQL